MIMYGVIVVKFSLTSVKCFVLRNILRSRSFFNHLHQKKRISNFYLIRLGYVCPNISSIEVFLEKKEVIITILVKLEFDSWEVG